MTVFFLASSASYLMHSSSIVLSSSVTPSSAVLESTGIVCMTVDCVYLQVAIVFLLHSPHHCCCWSCRGCHHNHCGHHCSHGDGDYCLYLQACPQEDQTK